MGLDRKFLLWALSYAVLGLSLGVFMGASGDHSQKVTHAHILLVGLALSFIYSTIHKLWLGGRSDGLARLQFILHHAGALVMFIGLFLLFGKVVPEAQIGPVLGIASSTVWAGMALMLVLVLRAKS